LLVVGAVATRRSSDRHFSGCHLRVAFSFRSHEMAAQTAAGTLISISAQRPATYDAAGYGALSYTPIGEIVDAGTHGRVYQVVTADRKSTRLNSSHVKI